MTGKTVGNVILAIARIVVYLLTGVHIGSDGKEVINETPSAISQE